MFKNRKDLVSTSSLGGKKMVDSLCFRIFIKRYSKSNFKKTRFVWSNSCFFSTGKPVFLLWISFVQSLPCTNSIIDNYVIDLHHVVWKKLIVERNFKYTNGHFLLVNSNVTCHQCHIYLRTPIFPSFRPGDGLTDLISVATNQSAK